MKRVLVVDDSTTVLEMARLALDESGFEVLTAMSAKEADPYILGPERPDLILMDVMLPVLDGDKKTRMLKDHESTREIPVLLLSSKPEEELQFLVAESGADGYIRKPFVNRHLVAKVEEVIGGRQGK